MSNELSNKREITGWLRNGITSLPAKLTGRVLKREKTGRFLLIDAVLNDTGRWFVSRVAGLTDRARGWYRPTTNSVMTGQVIRRNKLTEIFSVIYGRVFQTGVTIDKTSEYGKVYQTDTGIDLNLGGLLHYLPVGTEIVVYKIPAQFSKEVLLWDDITNDTLYDKS
ncbi:MAG: hypothetical protein PHW65_00920 [Dehalococcoidales bacterium]|nr:hypothetical protein [Dehalococcoidales bacterium]